MARASFIAPLVARREGSVLTWNLPPGGVWSAITVVLLFLKVCNLFADSEEGDPRGIT